MNNRIRNRGILNQSTGIISEYEEILEGTRQVFSVNYLRNGTSPEAVRDLLQFVFIEVLGWSPSMIHDYISPELIQMLKLESIVKKVDFPPELDRTKDLYYISTICYGSKDTAGPSKKERILTQYHRVLDGELTKYPKGFWLTPDNEFYMQTCLLDAINREIAVSSIDELYYYFADRTKAASFLESQKLMAPCRDFFDGDPLKMLHALLPEEDRSEACYLFASHGYREEDFRDDSDV